MDEPIWSRQFARRVARSLGYRAPDPTGEAGEIDFTPEAERIVEELTEAFRYLPPGPFRHVLDYTEFLRSRQTVECTPGYHPTWALEKLRAVCDLALFLKARHGTDQPADEKDYWTEEDLHDLTLETWKRLEEEDPWPEDDYSEEEQGSAQPG